MIGRTAPNRTPRTGEGLPEASFRSAGCAISQQTAGGSEGGQGSGGRRRHTVGREPVEGCHSEVGLQRAPQDGPLGCQRLDPRQAGNLRACRHGKRCPGPGHYGAERPAAQMSGHAERRTDRQDQTHHRLAQPRGGCRKDGGGRISGSLSDSAGTTHLTRMGPDSLPYTGAASRVQGVARSTAAQTGLGHS
jgi:hypothetical protein